MTAKACFRNLYSIPQNLLDRSSNLKKHLSFPPGTVPQEHLHIGAENIFFRGLTTTQKIICVTSRVVVIFISGIKLIHKVQKVRKNISIRNVWRYLYVYS